MSCSQADRRSGCGRPSTGSIDVSLSAAGSVLSSPSAAKGFQNAFDIHPLELAGVGRLQRLVGGLVQESRDAVRSLDKGLQRRLLEDRVGPGPGQTKLVQEIIVRLLGGKRRQHEADGQTLIPGRQRRLLERGQEARLGKADDLERLAAGFQVSQKRSSSRSSALRWWASSMTTTKRLPAALVFSA